ncbi:MAG: TetR/AcrR family transcriptional regulator [Oscillospiraceae bacterium]|nr:TetR/AcrR family transcriptional regulator [Oscillospiraceae bacterium]
MYKRCVTEQSARRQRELENGLLNAMLSRGYESISISELCDELGVPRKSFYRYFNGKEGALYALIDHVLMDFSGEVFSEEASAVMDTMERFFAYWKDKRRFVDAIVKNDLVGIFVWRALNRSMETDVVAEKLLSLHAGMKREHVVMFFVSGLLSLMFQWHHDGFKEPPREMAATALHLMTRPMLSVMLPK